MYGLVGRHKWSKWLILSYFFTKTRFSQKSSFQHIIQLARNGSQERDTFITYFFLSVLLGCLLGPLPELDMKLNFLMT